MRKIWISALVAICLVLAVYTACANQAVTDATEYYTISKTMGKDNYTIIVGVNEGVIVSCTMQVNELDPATAQVNTQSGTLSCTSAITFSVSGGNVDTIIPDLILGPLGHKWSDTYTADGDTHYRTCTVCSEKETPTEHTWSEVYTADEDTHYRTCTAEGCGAKETPEAHSYKYSKVDETTHVLTCICGKTSGDPVSHNWQYVNITAETHMPMCPDCDYTKDPEAHSYTLTHDADCHWEECACGTVNGGKEAHKWVMKFDSTNHWLECSTCGATKDTEAHQLVNHDEVPATCTQNGTSAYDTCSVEGCEYSTPATVITAPGHIKSAAASKAATCTEPGLKGAVICSACGEVFEEESVIPAKGHNWDVEAAAVEATCTEPGNIAYWHCSRCNKYFSDKEGKTEIKEGEWILPAGHKMTATPAVKPTCTEPGNSAYWTCSACEKVFKDEKGTAEFEKDGWIIEAAGHTPGAAKEENRVDPEPGVEGSYDSVVCCTVCNAELSREQKTIDPLPLYYTISFRDEDGTELLRCIVNHGETPVYDDNLPYKEWTRSTAYHFTGWSPEIVPAEGNAVYTAVYGSEPMLYKVSFEGLPDNIVAINEEDYAEVVVEAGKTCPEPPVPPTFVKHGVVYTFSHWTCESDYSIPYDFATPVWEHLTLKAIYKFENENGEAHYEIGESAGGCYIATCVYGSYDCPEVWVLRRFRDNVLAESAPGRMFIRVYYAVSPSLVEWFGGQEWFRGSWQLLLDPFVESLRAAGFEDTPYEDPAY